MNPPAVPRFRLAGFYLTYYAALGAFTPYWSLYLQSKGLGATAISVLMSLWYATRIVAPSTWTTLAARSPQPIRWLQIGSVLTLTTFVGFLLPLQLAGLFVAMVAFCFFYNAIMPQFESITLSHLGARSEGYGAIRVWGSIGFIVVVVLYGRLIDHLGVAVLPALMLPLFAAMVGFAFANSYARQPETHALDDDAGFRARLRRPQVIAFLGCAFLLQVSFGPYYTFFSIYLEGNGYSPTAQGLLWATGVLVEIGVFFFAARIFARWSADQVLLLSLLSAALRWWAIALWPDNVWVMVLAQTTHALSFGAFFAAAMQLLARYFPGRMNGHGQGVFYGLSSGVGGVAGALLAGQLWRFGGGMAFAVSGGIALLAAAIAWYWLVRRR
ncbi:MFS transporter [Pseudoxanthomonas kalamensis DSM 18571]|uniref:MFS transporter n=1 Tax=Pseudoxanthomonas kalamensis TaxID=289483 RepID=UPI001390CB75|nr:MFS transporter [Pseudoxanthomonas kalamensis]KAF1710569.1 MFS transporter [Pseudoxanthomonas kalamensis DSM 18571]